MLSSLIIVIILLLILPWGPLYLLGKDELGRYLQFPPNEKYIDHAAYEPVVFYLLTGALLLFVAIFLLRYMKAEGGAGKSGSYIGKLPLWGYFAFLFTIFAWIVAWTRLEVFSPIQNHTFIFLWAGYVICVNALCVRQTGDCLLYRSPGYFLLLFPVSSAFWWLFEYINRFVQNWSYLQVSHYSAIEYFILASASFAFVLPAMLSTKELIAGVPRIKSAFKEWRRFAISAKGRSLALLGISASVYAFIGVFPNQLFWFIWLAPLLMLTALENLRGRKTLLNDVESGDWHRLVLWALSGLICGFFWEMWNYYSLAKWVYHIPYVDNLRIFEMPLPGYAGYIPFGIFCGLFLEWFNGTGTSGRGT